jgi:hypothetical protein
MLILHLSGKGWDYIDHLSKKEGKSVVEIIELALKESVDARSWSDWE